jgi:hypothetical protein
MGGEPPPRHGCLAGESRSKTFFVLVLVLESLFSHEGTKPQRLTGRRQYQASSIEHPTSNPSPVLPASSKRSERVVKQSPKIQLSGQKDICPFCSIFKRKKDTHKILPVFGEKGVPSLYSRRYEPAVFSILNSRLIAPALRSHYRRGQGVLTRKIKARINIENKVRPAVKSDVKMSGQAKRKKGHA